MPKHVHIDFDTIFALLENGVRRADVFMGLGLNASEHQPAISHVLAHQGPKIELVKEELTVDEREVVGVEFGKWIKAAGLRELLETFQLFLTRVYHALYVVHGIKGPLTDKALIAPNRFERLGLSDQATELQKLVDVSDEQLEILQSLNQARNCYAHRRGLVGTKDVDPVTGIFSLKWLTLIIEAVEPDGNVVSGEALFGYHFTEGAVMRVRVGLGVSQFHAGEELVIAKSDLKQICLCVRSIGATIWQAAFDASIAAGVQLAPKATPEIEASLPHGQDDDIATTTVTG